MYCNAGCCKGQSLNIIMSKPAKQKKVGEEESKKARLKANKQNKQNKKKKGERKLHQQGDTEQISLCVI